MHSIRDFLGLIVPEYIPLAVIGALVGAVLTSGSLPGPQFLVVAFVMTLIVAAFNSFNAIADKEIDKVNKLYRPIPANKITENQALWFAIMLYALAVLISLTVNIQFLLLTFAGVILTTAYSYPGIDLKRKFIVGNMTGTIFYAIICPLAGWALYPYNPMPTPMIFFLFLLGVSLSISKDFMDVPGDTAHGAYTFPVKIGNRQSIWIIFAILSFSYLLLILMIVQKYLDEKFYALLIFFPLMLFNVNQFKHTKSLYDGNHIFLKIVILVSLLELTIILLEIWHPTTNLWFE